METLRKIYNNCSRCTVSLFEKAKMTENTFMIIIAIIIGVMGGFGAVGIRTLIHEISNLSFAPVGKNLLENIILAPWYIKILIPVMGGIIVGPLIYYFAPEAKGHGVPEVMQAVILKSGVIRPRVAVVKALASSITIGTGGSVGREGPIIQIGASLGSAVGQFFKVSGSRMKTLVGCGAAAGIAAAFNAPIAGALFAVEIILMDFAVVQFSPIVISSVVATVISHHFEGNFAAFQVPSYELVNALELVFYSLLGVLSGVASYLFIKVLYFFEDLFDHQFKVPQYVKPAFGGLIIGGIALEFPQVMGVGYDSINNALHGNTIWYIALILIFVKILSTSITLGSGGSGGIFAPSLFIGAMLGAFFGYFVHQLFPSITASPGAYALVAMGGLVAGTTRAPITAIIIVFELTNDYNIILPLMITCIASTILSSKLSRESIYTLKLLNRNINLKGGTEINIMKSIFVRDVLTEDYESLPENLNFTEVVNKVTSRSDSHFIVVGDTDSLVGILSIHDIKNILLDHEELQNVIIAKDIAKRDLETVTPGDNCQEALDKISKAELPALPVVAKAGSKRIIGMIWRKDILDAYHKEIMRQDMASTLADKIHKKAAFQEVQFMEGYSISEISTPLSFTGKSIKELNIRAKYNVDVLSIRKHLKHSMEIKAFPGPDYVLTKDDHLIVAGEVSRINLLKNLR